MGKDALCLAGDTLVVPGASLLAKGQVKSGLVHAGVGIAAKVALGPIGLLAVAANSYCKSKTGDSLFTKFTTGKGPGDHSIRDEVTSGVAQGESVEDIIESINEDVEDLYHEITLEAAAQAQAQEAAQDSDNETEATSEQSTPEQASSEAS